MLAGLALALGGCLLFASQVGHYDLSAKVLFVIGIVICFGGVALFAIGGLSVVVVGLVKLFGSDKGAQNPVAGARRPPGLES